ncbi:MAG: hypothetical protein EZS28_002008 [Streblomastix strix]|uniref:Uncharacterized protein n=1 Tax=Streblomastix strix TaxID=222440 RepID=A0A5J4X5F7_9EUKA|nr:MAG: hypothetical protein EZS28_002008 [Streblomastix strix]
MDGMLMIIEPKIKKNDNVSTGNPFENFQPNFNPNQYIDDLSQIPSYDLQEKSNDSDDNPIQRNKDHNSNHDVFGKVDLIQLQGSTQSKLKVPEQRRWWTRQVNGIININTQSSRIKQIAGGSDFNLGSSMDIDMEQMKERDLTQTQSITNEGSVISIAISQLGKVSLYGRGETASVFAIYRVNIGGINLASEIIIPQHGRLQLNVQLVLDTNLQSVNNQNNLKKNLNKTKVNQTQTIFQKIKKIKIHRGLHKEPERAKRIRAALILALNLLVRGRRAAKGANFASGRYMLMQVWRHQQEEQLQETPSWRSQTPVQQQLGGKLMRYIIAWETINSNNLITNGFYLFFQDNSSQEILQQMFAQCFFQGNKTETEAFKATLQEESQKRIIYEIQNYQSQIMKPKVSGTESFGRIQKDFRCKSSERRNTIISFFK